MQQRLHTKIGEFYIDHASAGNSRIGIVDIETVENHGPDSVFGWSTDQQEAILAAAHEAGSKAELTTPGGWSIDTAKLPAVVAALEKIADGMAPTERRIEK